MRKSTIATVLGVALGLIGGYFLFGGGSADRAVDGAAAEPDEVGAPPGLASVRAARAAPARSLPEPEAPPINIDRMAGLYAAAIDADDPHPGMTAFRAYAQEFTQHNMENVEEVARQEGLTVREIEELTFFGLVAMRTVKWEDVEATLGAPLTDDQKTRASHAMYRHSEGMKDAIREHVARGDPEEDRWNAIMQVEQSYLDEYYGITGMTATQLDELLITAVLPGHAAPQALPHAVPPPERRSQLGVPDAKK
ncbi:MAG TPA: hypothetical protein VML75_07885 [Kofleriaceae bacterium]|nr:hypothetical protein [Kofleriaceae bacterium]